ncbi:MAG: alpha-L-fucosidase [Gemmatimonas sp.]
MDRRMFVRGGVTSLATTWAARHLASRRGFDVSHADTVAERPRPSKWQLQWQRDELAMFLHFGVNTFTDREWGDGTESPSIFAPTQLDARQWARSARAAGFRSVILTAKHHDGFCLWPTNTTKHSVASSPFRGGNGDVVREMVDACRAEGLRPGLYLSPWDRNNPLYGDSSRYNDLYCDQLTELLTRYGKIAEVWFDGANGEGPNGKRQQYDWPRVWSLVRKLQPEAVMFSDAGPDVRWCGNENGSGGETNWSTVNPSVVTYPGMDGPGVTQSLQRGDPAGTVWRPAEADTSIRPGWFYHAAEDAKVRSVDNLYDLYFKSVGRNAKLLLNVPPTRAGLLHDTDVANLAGLRDRLSKLNASAVTRGAKFTWRSTGQRSAEATVTFDKPQMISAFRLAEDIENGQSVSSWSVSARSGADSRVISRGTTVGYARMEKFAAASADSITLTIQDAIEPPQKVTLTPFE